MVGGLKYVMLQDVKSGLDVQSSILKDQYNVMEVQHDILKVQYCILDVHHDVLRIQTFNKAFWRFRAAF